MAATIAPSLFAAMRKRLPDRYQHAWYLISTAAAAAAGQGPAWMPEIYRAAVHDLGPPSSSSRIASIQNWQDDLPRRKVVRQLKETLLKSTILVGVGHCIEAGFALGNALQEGDKDDVCVRAGFETDGLSKERGARGLDRVYKHNLAPIEGRMRSFGLADMEWLSYNVTYGLLLEPVQPDHPAAALNFAETELVVLTCLIARHAHREVLWHLRGCLRSGMTPEEVEKCQQAIEQCIETIERFAEEHPSTHKMPRVSDVREEDNLG